MAETQVKASKSETTTAEGETAEGNIEYVDMGDWTLEIDRRLPQEIRRRIPKAQRGVALDSVEREELKNRLELEAEAAENEADLSKVSDEDALPPEKKADSDAPPESITVTAKGEEKSKSSSSS